MSYQLVTYEGAEGPRAGVHVDNYVFDLCDVTGNRKYISMLDVLKGWDEVRPQLEQFAKDPLSSNTCPGRLLAEVNLFAPNPTPGSIFCAGGAYNDHAGEMDKILKLKPEPSLKERGERPFFFLKNTSGVCGPNTTTHLDAHITKADWEVELCVVIGRKARNVPEDKALGYVAGYMAGNDLSYRDYIRREAVNPGEPFQFDWFSQKCFDASCPTGPWIVPTAQVDDPQDLKMKLWVGDELMQNTSTSHMIFPVAEQVSALSHQLTLYPGDIIMTGTGGGVGLGRGRFLRPGETVRISIEKIGEFIHHLN